MKNFYITGISGFVGRNIVIELLKMDDIHIYGLVLKNEKNLDFYNNKKITLFEGDILDKNSLKNFLSLGEEKEKIVIHAAGMISVYKKGDPLAFSINYDGTKNMVDVSNEIGVSSFIYISSVDSLNRKAPQEIVIEQDYYDPDKVEGVYSKSKAAANNYVLDAYKEKGLPAIIICPSAIAGPNDPFSAPINQAIEKFLNDKLPAVVKGGYDIVDVRDVSLGIINASIKGKVGNSYLLAGTSISVLGLINLAAKITNKKTIKRTIPHFLVKIASPFIELHAKIHKKRPLFTGFSMDCLKQNPIYSHEKATKELDYNPRPLEDTIRDLIDYLKNK